MPLTKKDLVGLSKAGVESGASGSNPYVEGANQLALQKYLKGSVGAGGKYQPGADALSARAEQAGKNEENINTLGDKRLQDQLNSGGSVRVGDLAVGADPYAHVIGKQQSGDASARMKANQAYQSGLPKIQQVAQAATEGLDMSNDPNNIGSLGQARTLMLKSMGMNRYNEQEAKAVLPPTLHGYVSNLFNQGGDDSSPLNDVQRSNVNQFFKGQLDLAAGQHKMLKQNAMNMYTSSPYVSDAGMQAMSGLGAPMEGMFQQAASKYKELPQTKGPNLTAAPNPGPLDKLKSFFGGGSSTPQQQQSSAPVDEQAEFIKKFMAAKKAAQPQAPNGQQ